MHQMIFRCNCVKIQSAKQYTLHNANTFSILSEWVNPITAKLVSMCYSGGRNLSHGKFEHVLSRDATPANCHTRDDKLVSLSPSLSPPHSPSLSLYISVHLLTSINTSTTPYRNAWISIDLGVFIIPTAYTLRHSTGYGKFV